MNYTVEHNLALEKNAFMIWVGLYNSINSSVFTESEIVDTFRSRAHWGVFRLVGGHAQKGNGGKDHGLHLLLLLLSPKVTSPALLYIVATMCCCLTTHPDTVRPTDHGVEPLKLWVKATLSFQKFSISSICCINRKWTNTLKAGEKEERDQGYMKESDILGSKFINCCFFAKFVP